ncbi:helix-turn-helix transcriptional regulator [Halomonas sp. M4R1S46]|uniref:helix-turn-helix transcriptional regulator n=1 Tax=Halomonas sp. M4R1S46 TaxID=2982692 RepID=UPI0021E42C15|nr:AlpA family transcriptional regulator [Halomonas sp. M4R1S46]UYG08377.1 AlpA family transcriptional regulator [Halomonas sp. M4R1S46]
MAGNDTPTKRLIKRPEVREKTSLSDSELYRQMAAGTFPRAIRLTPNGRAVAWLESEVDAWIESRLVDREGVA